MSLPFASLVVFPLHTIDPTPSGPACGCGVPTCTRIGKHPAVPWKELTIADRATTPRPETGAGYGIKTGAAPAGSGVIVVDLDGDEATEAWCGLGQCPDTFMVATARGLHLYFQHPGFPVGNSAGALAPGIDIRGDGGYVVGPDSPHRSGARYCVADEADPAPCPPWLLEWLLAREAPAAIQSYPGDISDPGERARRRELYSSYLRTTPPCVEGAGGDRRLFDVVQHGAYDLRLPTSDVIELLAEHFDPRCVPPWGDELAARVLHKAHDAKTRSTRARAEPPPADVAHYFQLGPAMAEPPTEPAAEPGSPAEIPGLRIRWGGWSAIPTPPDYLVEGLLVKGKVALIYADPGSIKTWTAIDLARCVATGTPWLGKHFVREGRVLFLDYEDGEGEFHRRVHMLSGGVEAPALGYTCHYTRLDKVEAWEKLSALHALMPLSLLVIDTLNGATPGVDENDTRAAEMLQYAGRFAAAAEKTDHPVTVLVLHHANKVGEIRGTSAFKACVDVAFKLENKDAEEGTHRAILHCEKSGQKKTASIRLQLTDAGLGTFDREDAPAEEGEDDGRSMADSDIRAAILLHLASGPVASVHKLRELVKTGHRRLTAELRELEALGHVVKTWMGYEVDDDSKRWLRVSQAAQRCLTWRTEGELAKEACVSTRFVEEAIRQGRLCRRSSGGDSNGFMVLEPNP